MPDLMFDELLYLMYPLRFEHVFLDGLDGNHQSGHILDQNIVTGDQQLIFFVFLDLAALLAGGVRAVLDRVIAGMR